MNVSSARRLLADFRRFAGPRLLLLWLLMAAGALAEGFGIVMLVPLLALAGNPAGVPGMLLPLFALVPSSLGLSTFVAAVLLFLLLMGLRSLLIYARDVMMAELDAEYTADLRLRAASTLAEGGWKQASRLGLSGMQSLLLTEIPRCVHAAYEAQRAAVAVVMLCVQFTLAALLSPEMAGVALFIIVLGLSASWALFRKGRTRGVAISAHGEQSSAAGYRLHSGLKAALAQGTAAEFLRQYGRSLSLLSQESLGVSRDLARFRSITSLAAAIVAAALILAGQQWLELPFAVLATLLLLFARMTGPAQSLQQSLHGLSAYAPAFNAVEKGVGLLRETSLAPGEEVEPLEWRQLRLQGVRYVHVDSGFAVELPNLSLQSGEWLGLAGSSGGGKTTLADIAAGLLPPDGGAVLVDGDPLEPARLHRWRAGLAYVGQNEQPFEGTIRQNLLAGSAKALDEEALWQALEGVGLAERINASGAGLEMPIGDRGNALSGGERQRLAIARALLRKPKLIVLDEATNALDPAGEIALLTGLRERHPETSVILIAHRAAPLELCDRVLTMEAGRIA